MNMHGLTLTVTLKNALTRTLSSIANSLFLKVYFSVVNTLSSCQLCGSTVNINGSLGVCQGCGAEYDVIKHGRGRDFSKSVERAVNAQKYPTRVIFYLQRSDGVDIDGTTQYVGLGIRLRPVLEYQGADAVWRWLSSKNMDIYHRLDTGAWEKLGTVTQGASGVYGDYNTTLPVAGKHTYYAEFPGDAYYAGCPSAVHGLTVDAQEFSVSPEVSVEALPALTVLVKDMFFKKPIEGAKVTIDTTEATTDASGMAVFDALASGTYTLTVSTRDYKSESRTVDLTMLGKVEEVHLLPMWAIAAGVVGAGAVGIVVAHKVTRRK